LLEYYRTYPLFTPLNLSEEILLDSAEKKLDKTLPLGVSAGMVHKQSGDFVGFTLGEVKVKGASMNHYAREDEFGPVQQIIETIYDGIYEDLALEKFYFYGSGFTSPKYRKSGCLAEMMKIGEYVAVATGCDVISGAASNAMVTKVMLANGYSEWKSAKYNEWKYPLNGEVVYRNFPKPHTQIHSLVKRLSPLMIKNIPHIIRRIVK